MTGYFPTDSESLFTGLCSRPTPRPWPAAALPECFSGVQSELWQLARRVGVSLAEGEAPLNGADT